MRVTLIALLVWIVAGLTGNNLGWRPVGIIVPLILLAAVPALYWRHFQYGLGPIRAKCPALYPAGSKVAIETLEKLFDHLRRRTAPRAYFRTGAGTKRYVTRHVFMNRLRGLLLSENSGDRAIVLPPYGLWFSGEIRIEADPEDIIAALKPKCRGGPGREPKYAYADAMIDLIDNPERSGIDLGDEIIARRKVEALLVAWFQARADESGDAPRADMLRAYAVKVLKRLRILEDKSNFFARRLFQAGLIDFRISGRRFPECLTSLEFRRICQARYPAAIMCNLRRLPPHGGKP